MRELGVSIYPSSSKFEEDKAYLDLASKYGFTRIFTSLLEITGDREEVIKKYKKIIQYGNTLGMKTVLDINPGLFKQLDIEADDLGFFHEIGAYGVRMDVGLGGSHEAKMTKNPYGLAIEVNMSVGSNYINQIMDYQPDTDKLIGSHNFYPMSYSGLSRNHFEQANKTFNHHRINTAAFVTSQVGEMGPWPLQSGLVTLEEHRNLSLAVQGAHYRALGTVKDILIGNAYASEEELKAVSEIFFSPHILIPVEFNEAATDLEKHIILAEDHIYRSDRSEYMIRSSQTRVKYAAEDFPVGVTAGIEKGSLIIGNNEFGQYKGETQIALQPMKDEGTRNVVGRVWPEALCLIEDLRPLSSFKFIER